MKSIYNSLIQQTIEITELLKKLSQQSFDSSDDELETNLNQQQLEYQPRQGTKNQEASFLQKKTTPSILGALSVKGIQRKKLFKNKPAEVRLLEQFQQALNLSQQERLQSKLMNNKNEPTKLTFKCNYCDAEFLRQKEIIAHMNEFHDLQINNIELV